VVRVAIASVVSLLALPAAAHAALPAAHPPARSVAGVKVTWPLQAAETSLAPGSKLAVKVRSSHRRAVVSLLRADARGIPTRLLARRTLRSGAFRVGLPADQGAVYQLRVVVAGKRYWSWITTPAPPTPQCSIPPLDVGKEIEGPGYGVSADALGELVWQWRDGAGAEPEGVTAEGIAAPRPGFPGAQSPPRTWFYWHVTNRPPAVVPGATYRFALKLNGGTPSMCVIYSEDVFRVGPDGRLQPPV
jgi:hypothetical protein